MKTLFFLIVSSIFVFANVGKLIMVEGEVSVDRLGKVLQAKKDFILNTKDIIFTKNKAVAIISFRDGTLIALGKDSRLILNKFIFDSNNIGKSKREITLTQGIFRTIVENEEQRGLKLKTKNTLITINNASDSVSIVNNDNLQHTTTYGSTILNNTILNKNIEVSKGYTAISDLVKLNKSNTTQSNLFNTKELSKLFTKDKVEKIESNIPAEEIVEEDTNVIVYVEDDSNLLYNSRSIQPYVGIDYNFYNRNKDASGYKELGLNIGFLFQDDSKFSFSFFRDQVNESELIYKVQNLEFKYKYSFNNIGIRKGFTANIGINRVRVDQIGEEEVRELNEESGMVESIMKTYTNSSKSWMLNFGVGYEYKLNNNYIISITHNRNMLQLSSSIDLKLHNTRLAVRYLFN